MAECLLFKHGLVLSTKSIVKPCCIYKHNKDENFLFTINDFRSHLTIFTKKAKLIGYPVAIIVRQMKITNALVCVRDIIGF